MCLSNEDELVFRSIVLFEQKDAISEMKRYSLRDRGCDEVDNKLFEYWC